LRTFQFLLILRNRGLLTAATSIAAFVSMYFFEASCMKMAGRIAGGLHDESVVDESVVGT